jgi:polysaccharide export outer membrane protein
MSKKSKFSIALVLLLAAAAFAQQNGIAAPVPTAAVDLAQEHLQLAVSSRDYPVTLGDLYRLNYRQTAGSMISMEVRIDGAGVVSLGAFGKIDAKGLTFVQLKKKVEDLIAKNYSHSLPDLSIISPGVFRVTVRDGSSRIQYSTAWGLSRLSEIVAEFYSTATSLRNVELISINGESQFYDLLRAALFNEIGMDPLVKPGDTIILHSPGRIIELTGEVRRPGFYELMGDEGLKVLIETFGGGLSNQADSNRVRIDSTTETSERSDYISLPSGYLKNIPLYDGDKVLVRARTEQLPLVWFEGAVITPMGSSDLTGGAMVVPDYSGVPGAVPALADSTGGRFPYSIRDGQMLSDILQDVRTSFHPLADLSSAILFNSNSPDVGISVDIPALLSGTDLSSDVPLFAGYRIVIPSVRSTVMVSGAVYAPGPVRYKPNAPAAYYIILAGGADTWRNSFRSCVVYDQNGHRRKSSQKIQPGDEIHVKENNLGYLMERRVPVLASIVGLVATLITLSLIAPVD